MKSLINLSVALILLVLFSFKENTTAFEDNEGTISLSDYEAVLSKLITLGGEKVNKPFPDSAKPSIKISFVSVKVNGEEVETLLKRRLKLEQGTILYFPLASEKIDYKTFLVKNGDNVEVGIDVTPNNVLEENFQVNLALSEHLKSYIFLSPSDVVISGSSVYFNLKIDKNFRPGIVNVVISLTTNKQHSNYLFLNFLIQPPLTLREKIIQDSTKNPGNFKGEQNYLKKLAVGEWICVRQMPLPGAYLYYEDMGRFIYDTIDADCLMAELRGNPLIFYGNNIYKLRYLGVDGRYNNVRGNYFISYSDGSYFFDGSGFNQIRELEGKEELCYYSKVVNTKIYVLDSTTLILGRWVVYESREKNKQYVFYYASEYSRVK